MTFSAALLLANDTGAAIALSGIDAVSTQGGVITGTNPFTYTPPALFVGADTFSYEIRDASAQNAIGVVTVTVTADVDPADGKPQRAARWRHRRAAMFW